MIFSSLIPTNIRDPILIAEYLAKRFTYHGVDEWIGIINEGRVLIDGKICVDTDTVTGGDTISYDPGEFEEPEADLSYSVIYEDEWILGVDKPANLLVHRAGRSFRNNLVYRLRYAHDPLYPDCHPVHRLDRNTSGVVLVAKNSEEMGIFGKMFVDGNVTKTYKAIVTGCPDFETPFVIDAPISADNDPRGDARRRFKVCAGGKAARTIIDDIEYVRDELSLLTVRPITGRTHQIRVHLSSVGFPVAGDDLYGGGRGGLTRHALHCESLAFIHPHTGRPCRIISDPSQFINKYRL